MEIISTTRRPKRRQNQMLGKKIVVAPLRQRPRRVRRRRPRVPACPDGSKYLRCALGVVPGAAKIPDGCIEQTVAIEYVSAVTISPNATGSLVVGVWPGLPGSLRIFSGGGALPDRTGIASTLADVYPRGATVPFYEFNAPTVTGGSVFYNNALKLRGARTVTYSLEVIQVGAVLNQQGNAVTARIPMGMWNTNSAAFLGYEAADALYAGKTFAALQARQSCDVLTANIGNFGFTGISTHPSAKMCSATVPCELRRIGTDAEFINIRPTYASQDNDGALVFTNDTRCFIDNEPLKSITGDADGVAGGTVGLATSGVQVIIPLIPKTADTTLCGDFWTDSNADVLIWAGANLGTDTLFEIRATVCLELLVDPVTSLYRPMMSPPAEEDQRALKVARDINKVMPPSISKAEGSSTWWSVLSSTVTGIGELVRDFDLPIISPVAGMVAKFTKLFA